MADKPKKPKTSLARPKTDNPSALHVVRKETETIPEARSHTALKPTVQAAITLTEYNKLFGEIAINTLVSDLREQCGLASNGDLSRAEAMLVSQAHTLDAIFNNLARRAALNMGEYINAADTYLRLALKAQSQCRTTLETLAEIKNPRQVAFVRQANIANGPQQVNNTPHARENENPPNKLLEVTNGERLDFGATGTAVGINSTLEAVGAVIRPEDGAR